MNYEEHEMDIGLRVFLTAITFVAIGFAIGWVGYSYYGHENYQLDRFCIHRNTNSEYLMNGKAKGLRVSDDGLLRVICETNKERTEYVLHEIKRDG